MQTYYFRRFGETDAQQHRNLHTNKGFSIEMHAYRIIKRSVVKFTTSQIAKIAIHFSTNLN